MVADLLSRVCAGAFLAILVGFSLALVFHHATVGSTIFAFAVLLWIPIDKRRSVKKRNTALFVIFTASFACGALLTHIYWDINTSVLDGNASDEGKEMGEDCKWMLFDQDDEGYHTMCPRVLKAPVMINSKKNYFVPDHLVLSLQNMSNIYKIWQDLRVFVRELATSSGNFTSDVELNMCDSALDDVICQAASLVCSPSCSFNRGSAVVCTRTCMDIQKGCKNLFEAALSVIDGEYTDFINVRA